MGIGSDHITLYFAIGANERDDDDGLFFLFAPVSESAPLATENHPAEGRGASVQDDPEEPEDLWLLTPSPLQFLEPTLEAESL